ncbi:DUF6541 family protein [Pseudoclavibacter caeni]|jgi:hypothetical protein|uniref:Uncharacterized protein n=1 Tax=Pseudoclavibacter caeni TaxID=908846 RepID=A0A7C8BP94_9MICO|nr:DUF6541 family protein [Pseudoclavibacter caeni]KAB1633631.1 hypothetical protein F8O02_01510 [Pseudoclavibacter caeni]NYJ96354.1 hypothetical protein [Pseudoclavibacter caeni]
MPDNWWAFSIAVVVGVVLFWVPGLVALLIAHHRAPLGALLAVPPVISVAVVGVAAVMLQLIGGSWTLASAGAVVIVSAVLLGVVLRVSRAPKWQWSASGIGFRRAWCGAAIGGVTLAVLFLQALPAPEAFEQTFDTAFHLNAVQYIVQHGDGSALTVSSMTGNGGFYPTAWHDLVSLVVMATGVPVPLAANALNTVIIGGVWPLGMAFLAWALWPAQGWAGFAAGVLSAAMPSYPFLFFYFGSLYPNLLGLAVLPASLVIGLRAVRLVPQLDAESTISSLIILAVAVAGLGLAHPNALLAEIAAMVIAISVQAVVQAKAHWNWWSGAARMGMIASVVLLWSALLLVWRTVRPDPTQAHLESGLTSAHAIGEVLTNAQGSGVVVAVVSAFMLVGGYLLIRRRDLFVVVLWALTAMTFVIVAGSPSARLRLLFGGVFYQDANRIAALLAVPAVLLAAFGMSTMLERLGGWRGPHTARALTVMIVIPGIVWPQSAGLDHLHWSFQVFDSSVMIRSSEMEVVQDLTRDVPADDRVMVIPIGGGVFAYALTGREVTPEHFFYTETDAEQYIREHIDESSTPQLCAALQDSDVRYLLDFNRITVGIPSGPDLEDGGANNTRLIEQDGDARLLKITACGLD